MASLTPLKLLLLGSLACVAVLTGTAAEKDCLAVVQAGDTLPWIGRQFGYREAELLAANPKLKASALEPGSTLILPDCNRFEAAKASKATKPTKASPASTSKPRASTPSVAPAAAVRAPVAKRGMAVPLQRASEQTQAPTAMPDAAAAGASAPDALPMPLPTLPRDSAPKKSAPVIPAVKLEVGAAAAPEMDLPSALPLELFAEAPAGAVAAVESVMAKAEPTEAQVEGAWAGPVGGAAVNQALLSAVTEAAAASAPAILSRELAAQLAASWQKSVAPAPEGLILPTAGPEAAFPAAPLPLAAAAQLPAELFVAAAPQDVPLAALPLPMEAITAAPVAGPLAAAVVESALPALPLASPLPAALDPSPLAPAAETVASALPAELGASALAPATEAIPGGADAAVSAAIPAGESILRRPRSPPAEAAAGTRASAQVRDAGEERARAPALPSPERVMVSLRQGARRMGAAMHKAVQNLADPIVLAAQNIRSTPDQSATTVDDEPAMESVAMPDPVPELPGMEFAQKTSFKQADGQSAAAEPAAGIPAEDVSLDDFSGPGIVDDLREAAAVERASSATMPLLPASKRSAAVMG